MRGEMGPGAASWQGRARRSSCSTMRGPGGRRCCSPGSTEMVETRDPDEVRACLERLRGRATPPASSPTRPATRWSRSWRRSRSAPGATRRRPCSGSACSTAARTVDAASAAARPAPAPGRGAPRPLIARAEYEAALARGAASHILAGDIYQANLTFAGRGARPPATRSRSTPRCAPARARRPWRASSSPARTGCSPSRPSCSSRSRAARLTARPMKGTAPRRRRPGRASRRSQAARRESDDRRSAAQRSRPASPKPGSVEVPDLFAVETYPTAAADDLDRHRRARATGSDAVDVLEAIFPCGSITGAPKIRAMEIIAGARSARRAAPIRGAIGRLAPDGERAFNVAIRTLVADAPARASRRLGLGSGIVADSDAGDEWRECLAKGEFVATGRPLRPDRDDALRSRGGHGRARPPPRADEAQRRGARLRASTATMRATSSRRRPSALKAPRRLRLLLSRSGALAIESAPLPTRPAEPVEVALGCRCRSSRTISGSATRPATAPSTTRRAARGRHVRSAVPRPRRLPHRRQLHQPVRGARTACC